MGEKQIREREVGHRDARMEILSCSRRETASAGQGLSGKGLKKDGITESVPWTGMHACLAGSRNISSRGAREMRAQKKLSVRVGQTVLKRFCVLLSQDSRPAHPVSRQRQMPCRESPYSGRSRGMVPIRRRDRRPELQTAAQGSGIPSLSSLIAGMDWKGWGISLRLRCPLQDHRRPSREPAPEPLRRSE